VTERGEGDKKRRNFTPAIPGGTFSCPTHCDGVSLDLTRNFTQKGEQARPKQEGLATDSADNADSS
jgi:hypothetical protein